MNTTVASWAAVQVAELKLDYTMADRRRSNLGFVWVNGVCRHVRSAQSRGAGTAVHTYVVTAAGAYNGEEYIEHFCGEWTRSIGYGNRAVLDVREGFGPQLESGAFYTSSFEDRMHM